MVIFPLLLIVNLYIYPKAGIVLFCNHFLDSAFHVVGAS